MRTSNSTKATAFLMIIISLICVALCSCRTTEDLARSRAEKFYQEHPQELADKCADKFPVKDSVGEPIYGPVIPGNNENYKTSIDSLQFEARKLTERLKQDTSLHGYAYREEIGRLQGRIKDLAARYKPCVPDTVPVVVPHYLENTARIVSLKAQIAELQATVKEKTKEGQEWQQKAQKRGKLIGWAGGGLGLLAIGGVAWKLRKLFI